MNSQRSDPINADEEIVTARCRLRFPHVSDIPHIWSASRVPRFNDGLSWEPPASIDEIEEPLRRAQSSWTSGSEYSWAIEAKDFSEFIGWISIRREASNGEWSIGFWIHPSRQGEGYATECASSVMAFGFSRLGAEIVSASHATWNVASGKVMRRIGMQYVRNNPKGFRKNDQWVETLEYECRSPDY